MTPEERRERLANYWTHYYNEIRKQLPNYTTNPESVPHALRDHQRHIQARECKDGYVIVHFADPEGVLSADHPECLELITNHQNETVGELMDREDSVAGARDPANTKGLHTFGGALLGDTRSVPKEPNDRRVPTNGRVGAPRPDRQPPDRTMEKRGRMERADWRRSGSTGWGRPKELLQ